MARSIMIRLQGFSIAFLFLGASPGVAPAGPQEDINVTGLVVGGGDPDGEGPDPCVGEGCPVYVDGPPGWPPTLNFTVFGTFGGSDEGPCLPGPCNAPPPGMRAEILGCDGDVVGGEMQMLDGPGCETGDDDPLPSTEFEGLFALDVCGKGASAVRVVALNSRARPGNNESQTCQTMAEEGGSMTSSVPKPPLNGTLSQSALDCFSCEPKAQVSYGRAIFYKSTTRKGRARLYTLPDTGADDATFGETVNGEFRIPSAGQLVIELSDSDGPIDVWEGGWFDGYTRAGSQIIGSRTLWWESPPNPPSRKFSVRAYRGNVPIFKVFFHWYRWDEDSCCIRHEVETLHIEAAALPCESTGHDPAQPALRLPAPNSDGHLELRIPCCPDCARGRVCSPCDTSDWFVTFARGRNLPIFDGHAKGWRLENNTLWQPGVNRLGYDFAVAP